jgi:UDP-2-acetamido-3-amino-2,3-dideoxy-glucuronate N-acetyltransferase
VVAKKWWAHESAIVDDGAQIGAGTKIWHFCHVSSGARIGRDCVLGQNVYVAPTVVVGDGVKIQNNVSIYDGVTIDAHVFVGPSAVFTNVVNPRSEISRKDEYRPTRIGPGASIGANATIVCGHSVGAYAFIGAGAVVTANIPPYALVFGVPARQHGWMCRCGVQLTLEGAAAYCAACGRGYRTVGDGIAEA